MYKRQSHGTLKGLFRQIVEERTDILFPVKDLEQEGVPLPDEEYEMQHSKNGELQILYLAVSGNLHAMFCLLYTSRCV